VEDIKTTTHLINSKTSRARSGSFWKIRNRFLAWNNSTSTYGRRILSSTSIKPKRSIAYFSELPSFSGWERVRRSARYRHRHRRLHWSAQSRSPDGKMIATAHTIVTSGIGTGDPGTRVYLNWTTGHQPPTIILAFADGPNEPGGMNVRMNWLTPNHLELTYRGRRNIDFEAVKCHGVDISVRDLSGGSQTPGNSQ
jgi:hypothetical protein